MDSMAFMGQQCRQDREGVVKFRADFLTDRLPCIRQAVLRGLQ